MVILYVITQGELGGAQLYVRALAEAAKGQNLTVKVAIGDKNDNWLSQEITSIGGQILRLKHLKRSFSPIDDILEILELSKLYQKVKPDIIHLNSSKAGILGSLAFLVYMITNRRPTIKLFYTAHGWVFNEPMPWLLKTSYFLMEKITAFLKTKIICVSEFDRQIAIKSGVARPAKLITIHNGLNLDEKYFLDREEARQKLLIRDDPDTKKVLIGIIANFYPAKGLSYLIDAVKTLPSTDYKLIVIGDGELRPQLEEQIKQAELKDNIDLIGSIKNASRYLKAFDIAVMSSVKEGFPYFLLEAMSAGLPIVSTNVGGIPEIITDQETGLLTEPKNSFALAEKLKFLIEHSELRLKFGQAGSNRVKKEFSLEKMVNQTFSLYKK